MADREPILGGSSSSSKPQEDALYHDESQTPRNRILQMVFVGIVVAMIVITLILSIYRGSTAYHNGGIYVMLGLSLLGFVIIQVFMIIFVRNGDLPREKSWFLYFVGGCIILEAIFTDVLLYQAK